jgi:hypothetical protein
VRNLVMSVTAASASATLTADEIVVGTALGGQKYVLAFLGVNVLSTSTVASSYTSFSVAKTVPPNAVSCAGFSLAQSTATSGINTGIGSDANGSGSSLYSNAAATVCSEGPFDVLIVTSQTLYRYLTNSAGTVTQTIAVSSYTF